MTETKQKLIDAIRRAIKALDEAENIEPYDQARALRMSRASDDLVEVMAEANP